MAGSDENNPGVIGAANTHRGIHAGGGGGVGGKFAAASGHNRRALSNINRNVIGAPGGAYPCAVNKKPLSEANAICEKNPPIPVHRPITRSSENSYHDYRRRRPIRQSISCKTIRLIKNRSKRISRLRGHRHPLFLHSPTNPDS